MADIERRDEGRQSWRARLDGGRLDCPANEAIGTRDEHAIPYVESGPRRNH